MSFSPDYCLTQIQRYDYFTIDLPASAFGYDDSMIVRLSIDYGKYDEESYGVNVWASEPRGTSKLYICTIYVPMSDQADRDIIEALNQDENFHSVVCRFIELTQKHRK